MIYLDVTRLLPANRVRRADPAREARPRRVRGRCEEGRHATMNFDPTEDQRRWRDLVRDFARAEIGSRAAASDREQRLPYTRAEVALQHKREDGSARADGPDVA
ncbi:MAG: acyl-CoA dehydrogenase family protein [Actinomycetota bacterium]|nr:acyl-CoA dehydrogenase family protein [Actinomycetota bacterium]